MSADRSQDGRQSLGRRTIGFAHQHDLHQRHEVRRIPEVRAEHAIFSLKAGRNMRDGKRRRVTGQDCVSWREAFQIREDCLLERKLLRRRFDDDARACHGPFDRWPRAYAFDGGTVGTQKIADIANTLRQLFQRLASRVLHPHAVVAGGEQIGDAVAHQAGANHGNLRFVHVEAINFFGFP